MAQNSRIHRMELPPLGRTAARPAKSGGGGKAGGGTDTDGLVTALVTALDVQRRLMMDEFNRLAADYADFKKSALEAGVIPLKGVAGIVVTPTQYGMSVLWENPQQDTIDPTHVKIRVILSTADPLTDSQPWAEYAYPITTWEFFGLLPNTSYRVQIQLIARYEATETFVSTTRNCPSIPVLRVAESAVKSRTFTTLQGFAPPVDSPPVNNDVDWTFPDPPGGTPGTVGSVNCWWEYGFQIFDETGVYGVGGYFTDIGSLTEVDGDVGGVTIDLAAPPFDVYPSGVFRMKYREVCNSVPGDWIYTGVFMKYTAEDPCGNLAQSESATLAPFTDADLFTVVPCMESGSWLKIEDGVSGTEYRTQSPGYRGYTRNDLEWTLYSQDTSIPALSSKIHVPLLVSNLAEIATLHDESPFSLCIDFYLPELDLGVGPLSWKMLNLGGKISLNIVQHPTNYDVIITVPRSIGGAYQFRAPGLSPDAWNNIFYTHSIEEAHGRQLYANGILVDQSANAYYNDFDGIDTTFALNTFNLQRTRRIYGWKRAVTAAEIFAVNGILVPGTYDEDSGAGTNTITLGYPPGTEVGDVIIAAVWSTTGIDPSIYGPLTTEFTRFITGDPNIVTRGSFWYRIYTGTEGATTSTSINGSIPIIGKLYRIPKDRVNTAGLILSQKSSPSLSSGSLAYPGMTTAYDSLILAFETGHVATTDETQAITPPTSAGLDFTLADAQDGTFLATGYGAMRIFQALAPAGTISPGTGQSHVEWDNFYQAHWAAFRLA